MASDEEYDNEKLEQLARKVKPTKVKAKKGKKFADTQFMLSLVDQVNRQQEEKIQNSLEHESEKLKRLVRRERSKAKSFKETKKEKIDKMKEKLSNKKADLGKSKGDHRKMQSDEKSSKVSAKKSVRFR